MSWIKVNHKTDDIVWEWHVWDHLMQDHDIALDNYGDVAGNPGKINLNYFGSSDKVEWNHIYSIDYNAEKDQILLSSHSFNEIWIIDHHMSSEEAKSSRGDLLYRWGNPAYDTKGEQVL
ncbi:MAG: aryl-sulfate sulfotransferase [Sphaerochaeta sp.]